MNKDDTKLETFKVILLGDSGVGKTAIMNRYVEGSFDHIGLSNIGIGFAQKILKIPEYEESIKIEVTFKYLLFINYL